MRVPKPCLCRSCGVFIFVDDAGEAVASADVKVSDLIRVGDRFVVGAGVWSSKCPG